MAVVQVKKIDNKEKIKKKNLYDLWSRSYHEYMYDQTGGLRDLNAKEFRTLLKAEFSINIFLTWKWKKQKCTEKVFYSFDLNLTRPNKRCTEIKSLSEKHYKGFEYNGRKYKSNFENSFNHRNMFILGWEILKHANNIKV